MNNIPNNFKNYTKSNNLTLNLPRNNSDEKSTFIKSIFFKSSAEKEKLFTPENDNKIEKKTIIEKKLAPDWVISTKWEKDATEGVVYTYESRNTFKNSENRQAMLEPLLKYLKNNFNITTPMVCFDVQYNLKTLVPSLQLAQLDPKTGAYQESTQDEDPFAPTYKYRKSDTIFQISHVKQPETNNLNNLPVEIQHEVLKFCELQSLRELSSVSKKLNQSLTEDSFWRNKAQELSLPLNSEKTCKQQVIDFWSSPCSKWVTSIGLDKDGETYLVKTYEDISSYISKVRKAKLEPLLKYAKNKLHIENPKVLYHHDFKHFQDGCRYRCCIAQLDPETGAYQKFRQEGLSTPLPAGNYFLIRQIYKGYEKSKMN